MKQLLAALAALSLLAVPVSAERLVIGEFIAASLSEDTTGAEFEMDGYGIDTFYFNENNNLYLGISWGSVSGSERVCELEFCLDFDLHFSIAEFAAGYSLENGFTPFASISFSQTALDFGLSGPGIVDVIEDEDSLNVGSFYGHSGKRFMFSLNGLNADVQSLRVGGFYTLDLNNIVLGGSFETPTDSFLDSYIISAGIGYMF